MQDKVILQGVVDDVEWNGVTTRVNLNAGRAITICCYTGDEITDFVHVGEEIIIEGWVEPERGDVKNWIMFNNFELIHKIYTVYTGDKDGNETAYERRYVDNYSAAKEYFDRLAKNNPIDCNGIPGFTYMDAQKIQKFEDGSFIEEGNVESVLTA